MSDLFSFIDRTEPSSPTPSGTSSLRPSISSLPIRSSSESQPRPSPGETRSFARNVYKDVWNEFYDWEPGYCTEILAAVDDVRPFGASKRQVARVAKTRVAKLLAVDEDEPMSESHTDDFEAIVTHFDRTPVDDPGQQRQKAKVKVTRTSSRLPVVTIDASEFPPHPLYESCTPSWRSLVVQPVDASSLSFLPYADDETFEVVEYQAMEHGDGQSAFERLEWSKPFDPDLEMIQIETIRRLNGLHDVDVHDIDRMKLFGKDSKPFRFSNNTGMLWDQSQRDLLHWPGAFRFQNTQLEEVLYTPDPDDLRQRLMSNLRVFCPSINCLYSVCATHDHKHTSSYIPSGKPRLTGEAMILSEGVPCGPDCFRHIQDYDQFMEMLPPSPAKSHHGSSLDTLETVLGIAPDLFPCQLAVICLKPCKQVFVQRLQLFPDHTIFDADADEETMPPNRRKNKKKLKFIDDPIQNHDTAAACAHPDSCTGAHCPCYTDNLHCTPMCRCGVKCKRQWEPCNCTNGKCVAPSCACARSARECVPGVCIGCDAGGHNGRPCDNTRMQRMAAKPIEIKCGTHGLGAFACQDMSANSFLGTYTGHILDNHLAYPLNELAKHRGLNYFYEIPPDDSEDTNLPIFDATHLGNATRFLNHHKGKDNVEGRAVLVIGEHQIGFFTTKRVKKGEELFLNYGEKFWRLY